MVAEREKRGPGSDRLRPDYDKGRQQVPGPGQYQQRPLAQQERRPRPSVRAQLASISEAGRITHDKESREVIEEPSLKPER